MRKAPENESRPPGTNQGAALKEGTNDAAHRITPQFTVSDLPPRIAARITVHPAPGCWIAGPPHDQHGYARYSGRGMHRVVWELLAGPVPDGLVLDHVKARGCISVACCNPAHLEPVPHRVNVLRGRSFAAVNFRKDKCVHGHEFDLLNTYYRPGSGHRDCRACIRARVRKYQHGHGRMSRSPLRLAA